MISRVTVDLPLVPEIDTTGTRRSASRIHDGGEVLGLGDPLRPARDGALLGAGQAGGPRRRHVALGEGHGRLGQQPRPLLAGPRERDDPVARIGRAMDGQPGPALAVVDPQPADPGDDRGHAVGPVARPGRSPRGGPGHGDPGSRWPYHVRRRPTATSSLTTGSSR